MNKLKLSIVLGMTCGFLFGCGGNEGSEEEFTLVDGEILKTCSADGSFIYSPDDAAHLQGCQLIEGVVYLQPHAYTNLENFHLQDVVQIDGQLHIADSTSLTNLSGLNNLKRLNGRLFLLYNNRLEDITALSRLEGAQDVLINENPLLQEINLPNFKTLESEMQIYANESLEFIQLAGLEQAGSISISTNFALTDVEFTSLKSADELTIAANFELLNVDFPSLQEVQILTVTANDKLVDYAQLEPFLGE